MSEWTDEARSYLEGKLREIERSNSDPSVDGSEVASDIRSHVEEEVEQEKIELVTESVVRRIIGRIWEPEEVAEAVRTDDSQKASFKVRSAKNRFQLGGEKIRFGTPFIWFFGIILPAIALVFEFLTRGCTFGFFDPIPNLLSFVLVAAVPAVVLRNVLKESRDDDPIGKWDLFSIGVVLAVSFIYTLPFIPLMPFAAIGIVWFGIGLLALAPFFSVLAEWALLKRLNRKYDLGRSGKRMLRLGFFTGVLLMIVAESPRIATSVGFAWATSDNEDTRLRGVRFLRTFGSEYHLLEYCESGGSWRQFNLFGDSRRSSNNTKELYYRVTGGSSIDADLGWFHFPQIKMFSGRARWDRHLGAQVVGYRMDGLSLKHSRMDGTIEADGAMGYVEWTMEFSNEKRSQQEARALIELPPGAVVSRVTLWVNGEPREAAFTSKSKAIAAYKKVVRRRRDPLLVTSKGKDRVIAQCFPVPAGGEMKIRLGITMPLEIASEMQCNGQLPRIVDRNFQIAGYMNHNVWLESDHPLSSEVTSIVTPDGDETLRCRFSQEEAEQGPIRFVAARDSKIDRIWSSDPHSQGITLGKLESGLPYDVPESWILVLDGSISSRNVSKKFLQSFENREDFDVERVLIASDEVIDYEDADFKDIKWSASGGQDNAPALLRAWELAAKQADVGVLWIHGNQPTALSSLEAISRQWQRRPDSAPLFSLHYETGSNVILEDLEAQFDVKRIGRGESGAGVGLNRFLDRVSGKTESYYISYSRAVEGGAVAGKQVSDHLTRLWALNASSEQLYRKGGSVYNAVAQFAAKYQLVTPVSGAVVLENEKQYADSDLKSVDPKTVPQVPDSGSYTLIGLIVLGGLAAFRKWLGRRSGV